MKKTLSELYSNAKTICRQYPEAVFTVSEVQEIRAKYPDSLDQMQRAYMLGLARGFQLQDNK